MTPAMTDHRDHRDDRDTGELDAADLPPTIPLVVRRAAARFGDRDALVDGELTLLGYQALCEANGLPEPVGILRD